MPDLIPDPIVFDTIALTRGHKHAAFDVPKLAPDAPRACLANGADGVWVAQISSLMGSFSDNSTPSLLRLARRRRAGGILPKVANLGSQPATATRTIDDLVKRIGGLLDRFMLSEYANFFEAAGYQLPLSKCFREPEL